MCDAIEVSLTLSDYGSLLNSIPAAMEQMMNTISNQMSQIAQLTQVQSQMQAQMSMGALPAAMPYQIPTMQAQLPTMMLLAACHVQ